MSTVTCPALFLTAPASGQGKTTITAALARLLSRQGKVVRVFKTGPDYLDPQILQQASGQPVEPLDLWMAGEAYCRQKLYEAAQVADLILVEGVMGMFDGEPSSADLAARFNLPMAIVMDVKGMAQTAAAMVLGLASYRSDVSVIGLIANHCSSERHRELIANALPEHLPLLMHLARSEEVSLPERHLGLVQANEVADELEQKFEAGADWLEAAGALNILAHCPEVIFAPGHIPAPKKELAGLTIGIARDTAFSFIYEANMQLLRDMGAQLVFFSPLTDRDLPSADALWLPGGYPELHARALSENVSLQQQIKAFFESDRPILAECGGFLYCLESLTDLEGQTFMMTGIMSGQGAMRGKRGCQGMQTAPLPEGPVKAHAHHRSRSDGTPEPIAFGQRQRHPAPGEAIYRVRHLTATYLHLFFPSNPDAITRIFCPKASL
ncbi:MAG: cobyrinate a,c-diamide synthase [Hahellaceae bacterium]|nr:cobyrinate a,c-diamide synthase [Hahellaceae bacterium]MCP5170157.1 cobyrinate a,c-diamide synthase [Hahellaceae bacterium]